MAVPKRGSGIPTRGSGSEGGGSITVNDHTGEAISTGVRTLEWQTLDQFGFTATVDPDDPTKVYIGTAPEFADKIIFSPPALPSARIAESDPLEADTYDTFGLENTAQPSTNDPTPTFTTGVGRGFGNDARLQVVIQHSGVNIDDQTFICAANGSQTTNGITLNISNLEADGDGSVDKASMNVTLDLMSYLPYAQSGVFKVTLTFTEHKWGELVTFNRQFFYDLNPNTPSITGASTVKEHNTPSERVIKYLSGIGYYTTGSKFTIEVDGIDNHNQDSSHPSGSLLIDSADFGIANYTSSPWVDSPSWNNVDNLDTSQDFNYLEDRVIDTSNYRHIGNAVVNTIIQDTWSQGTDQDTNIVKVAIDTVVNPSTDTVEYFDEENMRLGNNYTDAWDSSRYLVDGEAAVYGGALYHPADLPRILNNTIGTLGTAGSLSSTLPNEKVDGSSRQNPSYTGFNRDAVFFRKFFTGNSTSYSSVNLNVSTNGDLASQLSSGDLKIYLWKLGSVDNTSPNTILPDDYSPVNQNDSLANSIWGHVTFNFAAYDDGVAQTESTSGCLVTQTGNVLNLTMGGYSLLGGVLVRFQTKKGVVINEVSATFV